MHEDWCKITTPLVEAKCSVYSLQNVFSSGNGTSIRPSDGSSTSITTDDYAMLDKVNVVYNCTKGHYRWTNTWPSWGRWEYSYTSYSKYNTSHKYSVVMVDNDHVLSNKRKLKKNSPTQYDENMFVLNDVTNCTVYVGINEQALTAFNKDGKVVPSSQVVSVTPANEFIGKMKRGVKQKVVKIEPNQTHDRLDDVEYFLSGNNYNFYTYKHDTNSWVITKDGMSAEAITRIPSYAFDKLFGGEDIFIKVKVNSAKAEVHGVQIEFDRDEYKLIDNSLIDEYGMSADDIKSIGAEFIMNLINEFSTIAVTVSTRSKLPCWQYISPGIEMTEYGGISWNLAGSDVATQHISGNMLIIQNVSGEVKYFKLEQKFFEDQIIQVGDKLQNEAFDQVVTEVDGLKREIYDATMKVNVLDQNVQLLKEAMENGLNPPAELPSFIIPAQVEIDLPPLAPGASTEITGINNLRYIQYWDTQKDPVPEFVEHKAVKDLQHHFIYENGVFTSTHFEMAKTYDTDNSYLMTESLVGSNTAYEFSTQRYTCIVIRSDGLNQAPRGGAVVSRILSNDADGGVWGWYPWESGKQVMYDMAGEEQRWMDFDFTFVNEEFIHGIYNLDAGGEPNGSPDSGYAYTLAPYTWQITTVFLDKYGDGNWVEHSKYTGNLLNKNIIIDQAIKKMRIRIEVPYSYNRGNARVSLKHIDIYYCPVRYMHDTDAMIKPILYYSTGTWDSLLSSYSDATIAGTATDIRYLFEVNNKLQNNRLFLSLKDGVLKEVPACTYANGMTLYSFNNLTKEQLSVLLNYEYIRPVAILDSVDGHFSPYVRSFKLTYAEKYTETTSLVNPQDINTKYDKERKVVVVTNATKSNKTLKAIIS